MSLYLLSAYFFQWPTFYKCVCELSEDEAGNRCELHGYGTPSSNTYPHALSKRLRRYFFCSTRGFMTPMTWSAAPTKSPVYPDCPVTWFKAIQEVRAIVENAGSQADSSSRNWITIAADMTLMQGQSELRDRGRGELQTLQTYRVRFASWFSPYSHHRSFPGFCPRANDDSRSVCQNILQRKSPQEP
jgi:hypothetical protein